MKTKPVNPNDHDVKTPSTKGDKGNDRKFTSYDTSRKETGTPQKVREGNESAAQQERHRKQKEK
ncbi:hypothetical protein [Chryseolinea lacunae]|uniref:Multidrug transporter n=1 Tax=Chryseolinea lacunae TaxID=2801331 RepID=A0ABS1KNX4_9BACT|nr:hypothetical protein [Chryseolinea lacunae]MBL0740392.1 hypothetical protein [Chryseolinea lacunae]